MKRLFCIDITGLNKTESEEELFKRHNGYSYIAAEIPDSVENVDVISYAYKLKKDREICKTFGKALVNTSVSLFEKDDMLCLADHCQRYDFPKACFKEFRFYNKSCFITSWNKEENFKSKKYAKYKISNGLKVKNYYSLIFEDQGQQYELLIMPYDLEAYKRIFPDLPIVNDK